MMKCLQKIIDRVTAAGATVDLDSLDRGTVYLDAPAGYVWACEGITSIAINGANGSGQSWWVDACADAAERVAMGLRLADDEEREEAEHSLDRSWAAPTGSADKIAV